VGIVLLWRSFSGQWDCLSGWLADEYRHLLMIHHRYVFHLYLVLSSDSLNAKDGSSCRFPVALTAFDTGVVHPHETYSMLKRPHPKGQHMCFRVSVITSLTGMGNCGAETQLSKSGSQGGSSHRARGNPYCRLDLFIGLQLGAERHMNFPSPMARSNFAMTAHESSDPRAIEAQKLDIRILKYCHKVGVTSIHISRPCERHLEMLLRCLGRSRLVA
jgi:hypothetical protein